MSEEFSAQCDALLNEVDGAVGAAVTVDDGVRRKLLASSGVIAGIELESSPLDHAHRIGVTRRLVCGPNGVAEFGEFAAACNAVGVMSAAAVPAPLGAGGSIAVTVFSSDHHGFGAADLRTMRAVALAMADAVPG